jgi:hypothetical protein
MSKQNKDSGAQTALNVLVSMYEDDDDLDYMENIFQDYELEDAIDALQKARKEDKTK